SHRALAFLCFFFSGATVRVGEGVGARLLGGTIGNTHFSITVVVSVFMGGLALGSFASGRIADRSPSPLRLYGLCVLLVGAACLLVPLAVAAARPFFGWLYGFYDGEPEAPPLLAARIVFSALVLLVPTSFMGATLPALSRHLARSLADVGATVGRLYAINTLGAVVGVVFTGFAGIRYLGVWGCTAAAVAVDVAIGIAVLRAARKGGGSAAHPAAAPPRGPYDRRPDLVDAGKAAPLPLDVRLSLLAFGIAGFADMLLQIAWTKAIVLSIGNSTYAFSLIVALFILGIAIGGGAASLVADRVRNLPLLLGAVMVATALLVSATIPLLGHFPVLAARWFDSIEEPSYGRFLAVHVLLVSAAILPSTVLMGTAFPIVGKIRARALETVGSAVGSAYFWNTLGSILGTVAAGFVTIPLFGKVYWTLYLGAALILATGLVLVASALPRGLAARLGAVVAVAALVLAPHAFLLPNGVLGSTRHFWHPSIMSRGAYVYFQGTYRGSQGKVLPQAEAIDGLIRGNEVLLYTEGIHAPVAVVKSPKGEVAMRISGKVEASFAPGGAYSSDQPHQVLAGHLPMVLHPGPRRVLTLGLGGGVTLGTLTLYPVESIDSLEISPEVIAAARDFFGEANHGALRDERVRNVVGDGRNHLEYTRRKYDVITSVPSNPWIAGIGNLFTVEFFEACRARLEAGGVLCNWIHKINMRADDFRTVVRTFIEVFGDTAQLWDLGYDALLIGGASPVAFDPARFRKLLEVPEIRRDLEGLGISSPETLLRHYHFDAAALRRYCGPRGPLNTDAFPVLEFSCPYGLYGHTHDAYESLALAEHAELPPAWTGGAAAARGGVPEPFAKARSAFHRFQLAEARYQELLAASRPAPPGSLDARAREHLVRTALEVLEHLKAIERDTAAGADPWLRGQANLLAATALGVPAGPSLPVTLCEALLLYAKGAPAPAERLAFLEQAAAYASEDPRTALETAGRLLEAGQPAKGLPVVEAALLKTPEDPNLLMSLGVLQGASGRPEAGLESLVRALPHAKDPRLRSEILRNAAYAYQVTGRREEALREYEKALAENPQNEAARAALEALRKGGAR
ncbi:MAG: fused MFS/spermidine synthase, partial [Planctomycetes bacterium]|nr:fused MFS/spermidine synthase [Planctomycetota bacterium]